MTNRMFLFFGDSYVNGTCDREMLGWCGRLARRLFAEGQSVIHYDLGIRTWPNARGQEAGDGEGTRR